jgi:hypothetical protein
MHSYRRLSNGRIDYDHYRARARTLRLRSLRRFARRFAAPLRFLIVAAVIAGALWLAAPRAESRACVPSPSLALAIDK